MSQVKLVDVSSPKPEAKKKPSDFPSIIHTLRQMGKKQVNDLLQHLFNNTDDALFELADRAQSDTTQVMYFDSMRTIRLHREAITKAFLQSFMESFTKAYLPGKGNARHGDGLPPEMELDEGDLALLDQDELEMNVAVAGIVSKITSQYSLPIVQLTKRLDHLAKNTTISERTNPFGPYILSNAYASALHGLEIPIKVRLILMKLFERFVMERLGSTYDMANRKLIEAGVLPELKTATRKSAAQPQRAQPHSAVNRPGPVYGAASIGPAGPVAATGMMPGFSFSAVQHLMSGARSVDAGSEGPAGIMGSSGASAGAGMGTVPLMPTVASGEVLNALTQLQQASTDERIDIEAVPQLGDIRTLVLSQVSPEKNKSLDRADEDTVNFVSMLFDYILNDRNLAIPMKALIGRLQIPIVKLAILDKSFFEKSAHPARALLNELSSAGIGWSGAAELKRDNVYNKIESVVLRVLNEFTDNPGIFAELVDDLRAFVSKDTRRSVLVEQRVRESEAGKAKTTGAKLQVQTLINSKASGLRLPVEAGKFVSDQWSRVLTMRHVKYGEAAPEWFEGVATLDDLMWMLQPLSERAEISKRTRRTSSLIEEITQGMDEIGCPADQTAEFTLWLKDHLQRLSRYDLDYLEEDEKPPVDEDAQPMDELILTTVATEPEPELDPKVDRALSKLSEGSWVEIRDEEQDKVIRCKLATVTQPGNNHVFVNRRGMKVLEKNRAQLAALLLKRNMKLIDESQVFDRALQSVIGNLRAMQRDRGQ